MTAGDAGLTLGGRLARMDMPSAGIENLLMIIAIAKAGGEERSRADTLFRCTELSQAGRSVFLMITAKRELGHDRIHRLGISQRMFRNARPHEPGSDTFGYRLVISREGGIDRLPRVKPLRSYAVA
jgi:hypothetical protein